MDILGRCSHPAFLFLKSQKRMPSPAPQGQQALEPHRSYLEHCCLRFAKLMERRPAGGHLHNGAAQGPDVSGGVIPAQSLANDLRRHVLQSACWGKMSTCQCHGARKACSVGSTCLTNGRRNLAKITITILILIILLYAFK